MEILSLGEKIRNRRKELNMTLKELAGDRVTAGQLSFVELGKSNPSSELLNYISKRLGVSVDYLLESEESQAKRICRYNMRLSEAYIYDNKFEDANKLLVECREIASKYSLTELLGNIEFNNGRIAFKLNDYKMAMEYFLKSNKLYLECHEYESVIYSYIMLGETSFKSGTYCHALTYFKQAEILCRDKGIYGDKIKSRIDFNIFLCCIKLGYLEDADRYLSNVESFLQTLEDKQEYAHSLMTISLAYKDNKDYDKALYYSNQAVKLFKEIEDEEYQARMEMNIGIIYYEKGDIEKSNFYLKRCHLNDKLLSSRDIAFICLKLANNSIKQSRFNDAVPLIEHSFKLASENNDIDCQIECYSSLSKIYFTLNNYEKCEKLLKNKLNLLESNNQPDKIIKCYMEIANFYNSIGDKAHASEYMEKCCCKYIEANKEA